MRCLRNFSCKLPLKGVAERARAAACIRLLCCDAGDAGLGLRRWRRRHRPGRTAEKTTDGGSSAAYSDCHAAHYGSHSSTLSAATAKRRSASFAAEIKKFMSCAVALRSSSIAARRSHIHGSCGAYLNKNFCSHPSNFWRSSAFSVPIFASVFV
eukprot:6172344-Pleurochrysis_carterae.AAC.3